MKKNIIEMTYTEYMNNILKHIEEFGDPKLCSCAGTGFYPIMCCSGIECGCMGFPVDFDVECPECGIKAPKSIESYFEYDYSKNTNGKMEERNEG